MTVSAYTICFLLTFSGSISLTHDKWIVVTTIQYPTRQLERMAKMKDWQLVVVGDKKTPQDWNLENCIYLSPETQLQLGYSLASLLPWNHYSRKNIGYLYAIEHGAHIMYDTDDDNEPIDDLAPCPQEQKLPVMSSGELSANIYKYFNRPDIWPRGYPLETITNNNDFHLLDNKLCSIGIEQGIVNNDPDLDAIYRLVHPNSSNIFFNKKPTIALEKNIFFPTNSQNTFFHIHAFFTLYIQSTLTKRVSDS